MSWLQRYRLKHYVQNSIWIYPACSVAVALILARIFHTIEEAMHWQSTLDPDTMRAVLGTLAGAMFTFIVFVCSSLLLVVQLASAQLSPRIIGVLFRDPVTKLTLSLFVFTFSFSISSLIRIGTTVPLITPGVAAWSSAACLCVFVYLIDHVSKVLRPSGALKSVATQAHQVIDNVYPRKVLDSNATMVDAPAPFSGEAAAIIYSKDAGVVLAFDVRGLVALAGKNDCVVELAPQVGNFVAPGDELFRTYGGAIAESLLYEHIALGVERTMEQDPMFAFRVIVDIASKGLSPAINDPTTAVLALDQIHHLLRHIGSRRLDDEKVRDASGKVRLIYRTPDWEDYLTIAVTEIRQFGGSSIQIVRRLRAMLEDLIATLPPERAEPLHQELQLVRKTAERFFQEPEDRALAEESDAQGMGGAPDLASRVP